MIPWSCEPARQRLPRLPRNQDLRFAEAVDGADEPRCDKRACMDAMTPVPMRVAAIQMTSGGSVEDNLRAAAPLIAAAARDGAKLVLLPENFGLIGLHATDKLAVQERDGDGPQQTFLASMAQTHGVYLIGGSVPISCGEAARVRQTLLAYGPDGARVA